MFKLRFSFAAVLCGICLSGTSVAQELMVFPNADQSAEQQQQDEFTCYGWAKGETGFDPMAVPTATAVRYLVVCIFIFDPPCVLSALVMMAVHNRMRNGPPVQSSMQPIR